MKIAKPKTEQKATVESEAMIASCKKYFPGNMKGTEVDDLVFAKLSKEGFND